MEEANPNFMRDILVFSFPGTPDDEMNGK